MVALAATSTLALAASAEAATTEIGSVAEIQGNVAPNPATTNGSSVQFGPPAGQSYTVPAGYGVITRFRHRTGTNSGTLAFKVYRPTGAAGEYTSLASESHPVTAGTNESFDTRIPVQPGDVLGLNSATNVQEAYTGPAGGSVGFFGGDPSLGSTATASPSATAYLDIAARVETDADGDGYGDDTQDGCPTDPADQTACAADTVIDQAPKKTVKTKKKKAKVTFAFSSPQPDVTFQCSIDAGGFNPCTSPLTKKFRKGSHTFQVYAVNKSGELDDTPASVSFKVKRKHHHH
jgi:hypothetical protein